MDSQLTWFSGLVLFGSLQGLILSTVIFSRKQHAGARYLAGFLLILAYNELETFNWSSSIGNNILLFDILPHVFVLGLGPCLYLYVRANTTTNDFHTRKIAQHFILPAVELFLQLGIYLYYLGVKDQSQPLFISPTTLYKILTSVSEPLSVIIFIFYLSSCWRLINRFNSDAKQTKNQSLVAKWLISLTTATSLLTIAWVSTLLSGYFLPAHDGSLYYILELSIICFLYWIGIIGYYRINSLKTYSAITSPMDFGEMESQFRILCQVMETEKLYLDPDLNQQKVSVKVGMPVKTISIVLSQIYQENFNDFVNTYRVKEVQRRLDGESYKHLKISAIAFESGFNSNATFQRVFKNKVGTSPSTYATSKVVVK
jgi:AraC-like DNA-binding protein